MNIQPRHLDVFEALHEQILRLDKEPMSPAERQLANAMLVLLGTLIEMHPAND